MANTSKQPNPDGLTMKDVIHLIIFLLIIWLVFSIGWAFFVNLFLAVAYGIATLGALIIAAALIYKILSVLKK